MKKQTFFKLYNRYSSFAVFATVFLIFSILCGPVFLNTGNMINMLRSISIYGICVTGVAILMISGGMDMSIGAQIAANGMFIAAMMTMWNVPVLPAILIGIVTGVLIGCLNGIICAFFRINAIIVTLCTMLIMNGLALIVTNGHSIYDLPASFLWIGQGYIGAIPVPVVLLLICVLLGWFLMNETYFGRNIYALGGNLEASRLAGINIIGMRVAVFALSSFFVAIATIVMVSRTNSAGATAGANYQFDCLTAAALGGITLGGGRGNILKAYLGVLTIGVLTNGLVLIGANTNLQTVFKGLLLLITLLIDALQKQNLSTK